MKFAMKTKSAFVTAASVCGLFLTVQSGFAQGSLTPPGAPAPAMLTLSQIEPRTPIASAPFTITQPGSYYLTANLTVSSNNAITIATNGVALDLNGFTISSTAASPTGYGILITGLRNITIANGIIQGGVTNNGSGVYSGSGFAYGIAYSVNPPVNVLVWRVSVSGCQVYGIYLDNGDSTVVESCTVRTVGNYGIFASTIKQSMAIDCGGGFGAIYGDQVSDCRGQCSGAGSGVYAATAQNCYGSSSYGDGVYATTALNCSGYSSGGGGDGVYAGNTAENCSGSSSSGDGVYAGSCALNCYGSSSSGDGVYASGIANGCYGYSALGTGVSAFIASVCHGTTGTGTALSATHNVNSF
jgi:hypothetical protein